MAVFSLIVQPVQGSEPLLLCGPLEKGRALAARVGYPRIVMADAGHAAGTRMRDSGAFGDPARPEAALLVECGQHWQKDSVLWRRLGTCYPRIREAVEQIVEKTVRASSMVENLNSRLRCYFFFLLASPGGSGLPRAAALLSKPPALSP